MATLKTLNYLLLSVVTCLNNIHSWDTSMPGGLKLRINGKIYSFTTDECSGGVFFKRPVHVQLVCVHGYFFRRHNGCLMAGSDIIGGRQYVCLNGSLDLDSRIPIGHRNLVQAFIPLTPPELPLDHSIAFYDDPDTLKNFRRYSFLKGLHQMYSKDPVSSGIVVTNTHNTPEMNIGQICYQGIPATGGAAFRAHVLLRSNPVEEYGFFSRTCKKSSIPFPWRKADRFDFTHGYSDPKRFAHEILAFSDDHEYSEGYNHSNFTNSEGNADQYFGTTVVNKRTKFNNGEISTTIDPLVYTSNDEESWLKTTEQSSTENPTSKQLDKLHQQISTQPTPDYEITNANVSIENNSSESEDYKILDFPGDGSEVDSDYNYKTTGIPKHQPVLDIITDDNSDDSDKGFQFGQIMYENKTTLTASEKSGDKSTPKNDKILITTEDTTLLDLLMKYFNGTEDKNSNLNGSSSTEAPPDLLSILQYTTPDTDKLLVKSAETEGQSDEEMGFNFNIFKDSNKSNITENPGKGNNEPAKLSVLERTPEGSSDDSTLPSIIKYVESNGDSSEKQIETTEDTLLLDLPKKAIIETRPEIIIDSSDEIPGENPDKEVTYEDQNDTMVVDFPNAEKESEVYHHSPLRLKPMVILNPELTNWDPYIEESVFLAKGLLLNDLRCPQDGANQFTDQLLESLVQQRSKANWFKVLKAIVPIVKMLSPDDLIPGYFFDKVLDLFGFIFRSVQDDADDMDDFIVQILQTTFKKCATTTTKFNVKVSGCPKKFDTLDSEGTSAMVTSNLKLHKLSPSTSSYRNHRDDAVVETVWNLVDIGICQCHSFFLPDHLNEYYRLYTYMKELFLDENIQKRWYTAFKGIDNYSGLLPFGDYKSIMYNLDKLKAATHTRCVNVGWLPKPELVVEDYSKRNMLKRKDSRHLLTLFKGGDNSDPFIIGDDEITFQRLFKSRANTKAGVPWRMKRDAPQKQFPSYSRQAVEFPDWPVVSAEDIEIKKVVKLSELEIWDGLAYCLHTNYEELPDGKIRMKGISPSLETLLEYCEPAAHDSLNEDLLSRESSNHKVSRKTWEYWRNK